MAEPNADPKPPEAAAGPPPAGPSRYAAGPLAFLGRLRFRLLLVVLVSVLPFVALVLQAASVRKEEAIREAGLQVDRLARIASRGQEQALLEGRGVLESLAGDSVLADGPGERQVALLRGVVARNASLLGLRILDPAGAVTAGAVREGESLEPPDPILLERVRTTGQTAVGNFRATADHLATVEMIRGIPAAEGAPASFLAATLHMDGLGGFQRTLQLSSDSTLQVLSPSGSVLVRLPEGDPAHLGKVHPVPDVARVLPLGDRGPLSAVDVDGVPRFFGLSPLVTGGSNRGYLVVVGVPREEVLAPVNRALRTNLIWTAVVFLVSLFAARIIGERFVLRRVNGLILATKRLAATDLHLLKARRRVSQDPSELGDLERSFDQMALHMEERAHELEARARALAAREGGSA